MTEVHARPPGEPPDPGGAAYHGTPGDPADAAQMNPVTVAVAADAVAEPMVDDAVAAAAVSSMTDETEPGQYPLVPIVPADATDEALSRMYARTLKIVSSQKHNAVQIKDMLDRAIKPENIRGLNPYAKGRLVELEVANMETWSGLIFGGIYCPAHDCIHNVHPYWSKDKTIITFFNTPLRDEVSCLQTYLETNGYVILAKKRMLVPDTNWKLGVMKFLCLKNPTSTILPETITRWRRNVGVRHKEQRVRTKDLLPTVLDQNAAFTIEQMQLAVEDFLDDEMDYTLFELFGDACDEVQHQQVEVEMQTDAAPGAAEDANKDKEVEPKGAIDTYYLVEAMIMTRVELTQEAVHRQLQELTQQSIDEIIVEDAADDELAMVDLTLALVRDSADDHLCEIITELYEDTPDMQISDSSSEGSSPERGPTNRDRSPLEEDTEKDLEERQHKKQPPHRKNNKKL